MNGEVRAGRIEEIAACLGDRTLVWFGIRGVDAAPLLVIPQFTQCYSITAPLSAGKLETSLALEDLTRHRVDLDAYDIDFDLRPAVQQFRRALLRSLTHRSAVTTYRPSHLLSALTFAAASSTLALGMFKDRQVAFEYKPWVETELSAVGIRTIPWEYVAIERRSLLRARLDDGPIVLRPSRASGGVGISVVHEASQLEALWQDDDSHLMGVAPFLSQAVPLNVNACVFDATTVVCHPASVQLIGLAGYTNRRFGYCGNDFAAMRAIAPRFVAAMDTATRTIGRWLGSQGFRGAFGVDFLLDGVDLYFAEVNARFQGSSRMAASLASHANYVDLFLDHVAAFLGLPPAASPSLGEWVDALAPAAQVVKHNLGRLPIVTGMTEAHVPSECRVRLVPNENVRIEPGGVEYVLEFDRQVTTSGFDLAAGGGWSSDPYEEQRA